MRFATVPTESKKTINKAGQLLASRSGTANEVNDALDIANRWRACHAYPINTFQATLRGKLKGYPGDVIVAQRLKRMPTIVEKLRLYPAMQLTTMQDIGGLRAVLTSVDDVYRLADEYRHGRFAHELADEKDYLRYPRDDDGYRSVHLIYKYRNARNPHYDGLRLELQIRTRLQHAWATAVETMGTLLGQALKSRRGSQEWIEFFRVVSAAFALQEGTAVMARYENLTMPEIYRLVGEANSRLDAVRVMNGISRAVRQISTSQSRNQSSYYHLIILNSLERSIQIRPYDRDNLDKAMRDYLQFENQAAHGLSIEPVLVSAGPIDKLQRAYPNFFLDIGDFVTSVSAIIRQVDLQDRGN